MLGIALEIWRRHKQNSRSTIFFHSIPVRPVNKSSLQTEKHTETMKKPSVKQVSTDTNQIRAKPRNAQKCLFLLSCFSISAILWSTEVSRKQDTSEQKLTRSGRRPMHGLKNNDFKRSYFQMSSVPFLSTSEYIRPWGFLMWIFKFTIQNLTRVFCIYKHPRPYIS